LLGDSAFLDLRGGGGCEKRSLYTLYSLSLERVREQREIGEAETLYLRASHSLERVVRSTPRRRP
jgi:hypothetical protein